MLRQDKMLTRVQVHKDMPFNSEDHTFPTYNQRLVEPKFFRAYSKEFLLKRIQLLFAKTVSPVGLKNTEMELPVMHLGD
jgi:hypothetical protein